MSIAMTVHEQSCRGCQLCVEACPTDVLDFDEERRVARPARTPDCIGCLTCAYRCPSAAIAHEGVHLVKNFYRDLAHAGRLERYL